MIDNCLYNDSFYKGTYRISDGLLTLTFNQTSVVEIYNEETGINIEKKPLKLKQVVFYITSCGPETSVLQRTDLKVLTKAFKVGQDSAEKIKNRLTESNAWQLLK